MVPNKRHNHYSKDIFPSHGLEFSFALFLYIVPLIAIYPWKLPLLFQLCVGKKTFFLEISNHLVSLFALGIARSDKNTSHLVRKAVTFGKEQPGREKLNCFSLSACCSKSLQALPASNLQGEVWGLFSCQWIWGRGSIHTSLFFIWWTQLPKTHGGHWNTGVRKQLMLSEEGNPVTIRKGTCWPLRQGSCISLCLWH